jgi:hypothetical protein
VTVKYTFKDKKKRENIFSKNKFHNILPILLVRISYHIMQNETNVIIEGDCQVFMWLVAHDRILANVRESKWRVGFSPS